MEDSAFQDEVMENSPYQYEVMEDSAYQDEVMEVSRYQDEGDGSGLGLVHISDVLDYLGQPFYLVRINFMKREVLFQAFMIQLFGQL